MCSASAIGSPFPATVGLFPGVGFFLFVRSFFFPELPPFPYPKGQERKSELAVPCMTIKLGAAHEGKHAHSHAPMQTSMHTAR